MCTTQDNTQSAARPWVAQHPPTGSSWQAAPTKQCPPSCTPRTFHHQAAAACNGCLQCSVHLHLSGRAQVAEHRARRVLCGQHHNCAGGCARQRWRHHVHPRLPHLQVAGKAGMEGCGCGLLWNAHGSSLCGQQVSHPPACPPTPPATSAPVRKRTRPVDRSPRGLPCPHAAVRRPSAPPPPPTGEPAPAGCWRGCRRR